MTPERYLELIEHDGRRLAEAAAAGPLDAPIPTCPGWDVRACVDPHGRGLPPQGRRASASSGGPAPRRRRARELPPGTDLVTWFDASLDACSPSCAHAVPTPPPTRGGPPTRPSGSGTGAWRRRPPSTGSTSRTGAAPPPPSTPSWRSTASTRCSTCSCREDWASARSRGVGRRRPARRRRRRPSRCGRPDACGAARSAPTRSRSTAATGPPTPRWPASPRPCCCGCGGAAPTTPVTLDGDPALLDGLPRPPAHRDAVAVGRRVARASLADGAQVAGLAPRRGRRTRPRSRSSAGR